MTQVAIYKQDNGQIAVVSPTPEALEKYSIQEIAVRSVPAGVPFAIVNASDLPDAPQEAWEIDDVYLNDGSGGQA